MFFSTFFGGDDASWATPTDQYVYWRNMQLLAGRGASNLSGAAVSGPSSAAMPTSRPASGLAWLGAAALGLVGVLGVGVGLF